MRKSIVIILIVIAAALGIGAAAGASYVVSRRAVRAQNFAQATPAPGAPGFRNRNRMPMMPFFGGPGQGNNNNGVPPVPQYRGPMMNPGGPGWMMPRRGQNNQQNLSPTASPQASGGSSAAPAATATPNSSASQQDGSRITIDAAVQAAQNYAQQQGSNFKVVEVMEFQNNFYAAVEEKDTGRGAFELLVDPSSGAVSPEMGPNMMWNTKYGHMSGNSGGQEIGQDAAKSAAQKFLETSMAGAKIDGDGIAFYGYYTFDYQVDGKTAGMLSVNASTGAVWLHTWHGAFVAEKTL